MDNRSLGYRAPLLWLAVPAMAGLAAGSALGLQGSLGPLLVAAPAAAAALVAADRPRVWGACLAIALLGVGAAAGILLRNRLPAWEPLPPREAALHVRMERLFPTRDPARITGIGEIVHADHHLGDLVGQRVHCSLSANKDQSSVTRGAVVATTGVLTVLPANPGAGSFEGYLAAAGVNFRLNRGRLLSEERPAPAYQRFCAAAATRFREILDLGISGKRPELAALLRGMMLGEKHEISDEQQAVFLHSGTLHLFAISGLNIGVIAAALHALLALARVPRWPRFLASAALLWVFVDITGASPSAVRAWLMAVFLESAIVLARPRNVLAALAASAFAAMLVAPLQVFSASFLMSYGIVLALLLLGLPLAECWQSGWTPWRSLPEAAWNRWQRGCFHAWTAASNALAIGIATMLVGILTGIQYFGLVTPGSLLANLALIPAAGAVTLAGFASLLSGLAGFDAGAILTNHAAALVLLVIERTLQAAVGVPGAFLTARYAAPWVGNLALGALIASILAGYAGGWRRERGGWWPPFAIVAITLLLGVRYGAD
jgi:competence protein ComEC